MTLNFGNNLFPPRGEIITSYNYTDIAEGTGVSTFYFLETKDSAGTNENLSGNIIYSSSVLRTLAVGANDWDFDLTKFNMPKTIRGTALVNLSVNVGAGIAPGASLFFLVKIRKWDGSTETEIASIQTETYLQGTGTTGQHIFSSEIVIPKTHFKKGEILRVSLQPTLTSGGSASAQLGIDPKDRTSGSMITTASQINIPFELNI